LIWLYLKEKTGFFSGKKRVLHIAPEACFIPRFEKIHGSDYITADIESPLAKVKMDIHNIPFDQNTFDVVLCNHVLEHVTDDIRAISEINRVLKPGGFAILQVPFFSPVPDETFEDPSIVDKHQREKIFGQDDHVRKYGKDYPLRIRKGGLNPFEDAFASELGATVQKQFGIVKEEVIYGGTKSQAT
jgi:ubiquinone/menaquinone biosynthesis C-methylase UbiE